MSGELTVRAVIGEHIVELRYSNRARYRIGTLDRPLLLSDINKPKRGFAALAQWLWACLHGDSAKHFETPDDLAAALKDDQVQAAIDALGQAIALSVPSAKNADSSTPKPSPASS